MRRHKTYNNFPNTSSEKKESIFDENYKKKDQKIAKEINTTWDSSEDEPNAQEGRFTIALKEIVSETVLGDSGVDFREIDSW